MISVATEMSSANDKLGWRGGDLVMRIFLILFGSLFAISGAWVVNEALQNPARTQTGWGLLFPLVGCLVGCLRVYAGINKRTEIGD